MISSFVEGPFLWFASLFFIIGLLTRVALFLTAAIKGGRPKNGSRSTFYGIILRSLIPFHMGAIGKPFYAALRYMFHICLFVVPLGLAGHVALWAQSRFAWEWTPLPDHLADWLTLTLFALIIYFLVRRLVVGEIRRRSKAMDFVLLVIVAFPFLSGYFLAHGAVDYVGFLGRNMYTIHVLSAEAILLTAAFLFLRIRISTSKCTGCASCEKSCPTAAIVSRDKERLRTFYYSIHSCIGCGSCFCACPEEAVELRHEISIRDFFRLFSIESIHEVELAVCQQCGALFSPELVLRSIEQIIVDDYRHLCSNCKRTRLAIDFYNLAPWEKGLPEKPKGDEAVAAPDRIS